MIAFCIGLVIWVAHHMRLVKSVTKDFPLGITDHTNKNLAVISSIKNIINRPRPKPVWHRQWGLIGDRKLRHVLSNGMNRGLEQGGRNFLATSCFFTFAQCRLNTNDPIHAAHNIYHTGTSAQRSTRWACHVSQSAHHLYNFVQCFSVLIGAG